MKVIIIFIITILIAVMFMTFTIALLRINQPKTSEEQALEDEIQMQAIKEMTNKKNRK